MDTDIIRIWEGIGAEVNLVGSLSTGLLMRHRDIDFHIYSHDPDTKHATPHKPQQYTVDSRTLSFLWMDSPPIQTLPENYQDRENKLWQIDMIHLLKGSRYDGYFEQVAKRLLEVMTEEIRRTILTLKYETPDTEHIMGVEYYQAVIQGGVRDYSEFMEWRKQHPVTGIIEWMP